MCKSKYRLRQDCNNIIKAISCSKNLPAPEISCITDMKNHKYTYIMQHLSLLGCKISSE